MKLALLLTLPLFLGQCQTPSQRGAATYTVYPNSVLKTGDFWYFSIDSGSSTVYLLQTEKTQFVFEYPADKTISIDFEDEIPLTKFMIIHEGCQYQPTQGYLRERSGEKARKTFAIKLEATFIDGDQRPVPLKIDQEITFHPSRDSI